MSVFTAAFFCLPFIHSGSFREEFLQIRVALTLTPGGIGFTEAVSLCLAPLDQENFLPILTEHQVRIAGTPIVSTLVIQGLLTNIPPNAPPTIA